MKVFDRLRIPTADHKPIKLNLDSRHTTTTDFMHLDVPYIRRMLPKEKLDININVHARLAGMPLPTYGDATLNLRAFFVPYRTVFPAWLDFYEDTLHTFADGSVASVNYVPFVTNSTLVNFFRQSSYATETTDTTNADFCYIGTNPPAIYYKFTASGRAIYKILRQLGYQVDFDIIAANQANYNKLNALDLLCYAKAFMDYYFPSQYAYSSQFHELDALFRFDTGVREITVVDLERIFSRTLLVYYANDFFTAAFDDPSGPRLGASSAYDLKDTSISTSPSDYNNSHSVSQTSYSGSGRNTNTTPVLNSTQSGSAISTTTAINLSQYALMALRKLSDFIKRHQLSGSRAVDRFLSQYGIKMDNDKSGRCYYLGSARIPLQVRDVMSTAQTFDGSDGANLGDYAGKGMIADGNIHFSCDAGQDMGTFIVLSSIVPNVAYYQGYDKQSLNATRLDFYMPEFDGLGTRAIEKGELFTTLRTEDITDANDIRGVFGFTPQYAEYKIPFNRLTGDFNCKSVSGSGFTSEAWHLFRTLNPTGYGALTHNLGFVRGGDWEQYLRMFYNDNGSADHFVLNYLFNVSSVAPVKALFDSYEFEHNDGNEIEMTPNGTTVN